MSELDRMIKRAFDGVARRQAEEQQRLDNAARLRAERIPVRQRMALEIWGRLSRGNGEMGGYRSPLAGLGSVAGRDIGVDTRHERHIASVVQAALRKVGVSHRRLLQLRFVLLQPDRTIAYRMGIPQHDVALAIADAVRAIWIFCDAPLRRVEIDDVIGAH